MASVLQVETIKDSGGNANAIEIANSSANVTIGNLTATTAAINGGSIGSAVTHGNINLQRTITNTGVFTNGNNDERHDILTMQDPGFYLVELGYWRSDTTNSSLKGTGQAFAQYISGTFNVYYSRSEGNSTNNIDVANTGTTLQLKFITASSGAYDVQFNYIVLASHDI